jgi:hypothetical protein|eukprot:3236829-Prymnesium_polylepis.1
MEMCECVCDEMLEPMHYKQSCAYVSVPQMLKPQEPVGMLDQIASSIGPTCPTANCSSTMKIQRYLMSPTPGLICIALTWEDLEAQPNSIQLLMSHVQQRIDIQRAFHGVAQSTVASLKVGLLPDGRFVQRSAKRQRCIALTCACDVCRTAGRCLHI